MATLDDIKQWFDRDLRSRVTLIPPADPDSFQFRTDQFVYTVTVKDNWLGCTCRTRFNAPGEDHPRFADLPDGPLTEETWQQIVEEIKRMEIKTYRGLAL
jgi:hypothetical protein